jgi:hypothetical protein
MWVLLMAPLLVLCTLAAAPSTRSPRHKEGGGVEPGFLCVPGLGVIKTAGVLRPPLFAKGMLSSRQWTAAAADDGQATADHGGSRATCKSRPNLTSFCSWLAGWLAGSAGATVYNFWRLCAASLLGCLSVLAAG